MTTYVNDIPGRYRDYPISASFNDDAIGLALPIGESETAVLFKQTYTTIEQAKANLKNLLLTSPGERIMHPTLGSGLNRLLFELVTDEETLRATVDEIVDESIATWLPYISVNELTTTWDANNNKINITILLSLKSDPTVRDTLFISISSGEL